MNGTNEKTVSLMNGVVLTRSNPAISKADETEFPAYQFEVAQVDDDIPHRPFPPLPADPGVFYPEQPSTRGNELTTVQNAWKNPVEQGAPAAAVKSWLNIGLNYLGRDPKKMDPTQSKASVVGAIPPELLDDLPV